MSGEGSIYKRGSDGRWVATISRGPRGERQIRSVYTRTKSEAQTALAELRANHGPLSPRTLTVGAFLERWVRDARDIRDTTRHGYRAAIVTHLNPALGPIRLADLSPMHVEAMLHGMDGRASRKTARNAHVVLRRALGQAVRMGLVTRNVAAREFVDAPRVTATEPDALTPAEIALVRAVDHPLSVHVVVAIGTGLRQGEQLGLAWEDIKGDRLHVHKELARVNGKYQRVEPKTERSKRTVPLTPTVQAALAAHRDRLIAQGFVPTATGPVFVNTKGGPLSGSWLTHAWYGLLETAGVKRRPWKVLRATFASQLHAAGVPERTIADLMGHSRTHTTQRHYISTADADLMTTLERAVG